MIDLTKLFKQRRATSVLGLALDGNRLEIVSVRRGPGGLQVKQALAVPLALSPLTDDAELVGREIRNHLDQAGIRERRCVVCLPLSWILSLQTQVPELPDDERESFLQIEAERGFHSGTETLFTGNSLFKSPNGVQYATLMAAPREQLDSMQRVLRAARLKPLSFALGVTALQSAKAEPGRVVLLAVRSNTVDLQVTGGGGIVALRSLDNVIESEGGQKKISPELVAREIRITLGQLPAGLAEAAGKVKIIGQGEMARQLINDLPAALGHLGMQVEVAARVSGAAFELPPTPEFALSSALALAANYVSGTDSTPDFLPPKVQPWKQLLATRLSPRKLAWAGGVAGAIVFGVIVAFGVQQWLISSLQSKWNAIEPTVTELNGDQDMIKQFRPFYDKSFRETLARVIAAYPDDGSVAAKTVELRDVTAVTSSGNARDNASFMKLDTKLADNTNEISALHAEVRGQKPMQFTINFTWGEGGSGGE